MNTTEQKKGRGRPHGSGSFSTVLLSDLNKKFSPDQTVQIGRIWYEKAGFVTNTVPPVEEQKVEMILTP